MTRRKKLFMETTQVPPQKSVNEIQNLLVEYGATAILTEYENGEVVAVSFKHKTGDMEIPYRLPSKWQEVKKLLIKHRKTYKLSALDAVAKRIAWRQTRRWVEAQLAYVQTNQVKFEQVFLAYIQVGPQTLYERLEGNQFKMLEFKEKNP